MGRNDSAFAVSTVMFFAWLTLWIISYDNIWLKIPLIADLFPLPLPSGNLSYPDAVTSVGILGTLVLGLLMGHYGSSLAKQSSRGFHRD